MAEYVYPALFHENGDGSYTITYPDLPGYQPVPRVAGGVEGAA